MTEQFRHDYTVWRSMDRAPKNCEEVQLLMKDGRVVRNAHWAEDLSGEEQPPFIGWFIPVYRDDGNRLRFDQVPGEPVGWAVETNPKL